jgi:hypothetical protein
MGNREKMAFVSPVHVCEMEIPMKNTQGNILGPKFVDKKLACFSNPSGMGGQSSAEDR